MIRKDECECWETEENIESDNMMIVSLSYLLQGTISSQLYLYYKWIGSTTRNFCIATICRFVEFK